LGKKTKEASKKKVFMGDYKFSFLDTEKRSDCPSGEKDLLHRSEKRFRAVQIRKTKRLIQETSSKMEKKVLKRN